MAPSSSSVRRSRTTQARLLPGDLEQAHHGRVRPLHEAPRIAHEDGGQRDGGRPSGARVHHREPGHGEPALAGQRPRATMPVHEVAAGQGHRAEVAVALESLLAGQLSNTVGARGRRARARRSRSYAHSAVSTPARTGSSRVASRGEPHPEQRHRLVLRHPDGVGEDRDEAHVGGGRDGEGEEAAAPRGGSAPPAGSPRPAAPRAARAEAGTCTHRVPSISRRAGSLRRKAPGSVPPALIAPRASARAERHHRVVAVRAAPARQRGPGWRRRGRAPRPPASRAPGRGPARSVRGPMARSTSRRVAVPVREVARAGNERPDRGGRAGCEQEGHGEGEQPDRRPHAGSGDGASEKYRIRERASTPTAPARRLGQRRQRRRRHGEGGRRGEAGDQEVGAQPARPAAPAASATARRAKGRPARTARGRRRGRARRAPRAAPVPTAGRGRWRGRARACARASGSRPGAGRRWPARRRGRVRGVAQDRARTAPAAADRCPRAR